MLQANRICSAPILRSLHTTAVDDVTKQAANKIRDQLRFYAVAEIAGRPLLITKNDLVTVNRLRDVSVGDVLKLDKVRELGSKDYVLRGQPYVNEQLFNIQATVVEHTKSKMISIVKKKRRKNYKRTISHKQTHTVLRISNVDVNKLA
jgi:large subunit ribosomal protein L21